MFTTAVIFESLSGNILSLLRLIKLYMKFMTFEQTLMAYILFSRVNNTNIVALIKQCKFSKTLRNDNINFVPNHNIPAEYKISSGSC
jgi:hypothetical protein